MATTHQREDPDRRLLAQYAISRSLAEAETVEVALARVLAELGNLGWQFGVFWLLDSPRKFLRVVATWSADASTAEFEVATRALTFARGRGLPGRVWETCQPVWLTDVLDSEHFQRQELARRHGLRSAFAFPVLSFDPKLLEDAARADRTPTVVGVIELLGSQAEPPDEQLLQSAAGLGFQIGAFLDRHRAIDAGRADRIRNASVVEVALDCIVMMDHEGRIVEWNPAAERTFGHPRAQVLGRQMAEVIIPPHLREAHYRGFARYLQTGDAHVLGRRIEVEGMRAGGDLFPCELAITRVPSPGPPLFTAYLRDLTERRRLESAQQLLLRATSVLLSSLDYEQTLRNLSDVVVPAFADWYAVDIVDPDQTIRRLETRHRDSAKMELARELASRYANRPESAYGAPAVIRTAKSQLVPEVTDEMLASAAQDNEHLRLLRALGLRSFSVVPLRSREGTLGAITFVTAESGRRYDERDLAVAEELGARAAQAIENARLFADVEESRELLEQQATELETQAAELEGAATELEASNAELRAANEELAQRTQEAERARADAEGARREADEANRAKGDFLAAMSHELRTPLNAIMGYAELLEVGVHGPINDEQRADLARIVRSSQHLLGLINDILNFAKVERGRLRFHIESVALEDVLTAVEDFVGPQARAKNLEYHLTIDCPGVRVCADREKLLQIFVNLMSNAVRFTGEGGRIDVSCSAHGNNVRIEVRDTGIGMPADKLEAIFEPFVQIDRGYPGQRQGTGLGLAISRELARSMGGDLSVTSEVGKGSAFTLHVPRDLTGSSGT
jgi:PAS domain S-box-containing protein